MNVDTISALATGIGTLILAIATFFATSSANRAARTAELAIQIAQRPLLMTSKLTDDRQKIMFADDRVGGPPASEGVAGGGGRTWRVAARAWSTRTALSTS